MALKVAAQPHSSCSSQFLLYFLFCPRAFNVLFSPFLFCRYRTSGTYKLNFVDPSAPAAPPPPGAPISSTPLAVGPTFPSKSPLDLSSGSMISLPVEVASACPDGYGTALGSTLYRKNVLKLSGLPTSGSLSINTCDMAQGQWDSLMVFLSCNQGTTTCTCWADDDGCAIAGGSSIAGATLSSGKDFYTIVMPYSP